MLLTMTMLVTQVVTMCPPVTGQQWSSGQGGQCLVWQGTAGIRSEVFMELTWDNGHGYNEDDISIKPCRV